MATIIDTIKHKYNTGSMLIKLIFINIGVFLALRIGAIICTFGGFNIETSLLHWIELPSSPAELLTRPWTLITYMFAQFDIFHILFNMLWLYWFGTVFLLTENAKQLVALYFYGGICGALAFIGAYNTFPNFTYTDGWLIGASASVIAIVVATAMRHPDYKMHLIFFGAVSLKWIAIVTIAIDFLSINGSNAGGHIAHLGGAVIGLLYSYMLNKGTDITRPFNSAIDYLVSIWKGVKSSSTKQPKAKKYNHNSSSQQSYNAQQQSASTPNDREILDNILDKIKKSGYSSLSDDEKKRLFDVSKRVK
ncbi:MAG: rhomboid family intramembrane serine protease [Muribaculaceae bacterium]|nr:rhomboid family intramembrane serine protease [Muribaculaceae bacterium]